MRTTHILFSIAFLSCAAMAAANDLHNDDAATDVHNDNDTPTSWAGRAIRALLSLRAERPADGEDAIHGRMLKKMGKKAKTCGDATSAKKCDAVAKKGCSWDAGSHRCLTLECVGMVGRKMCKSAKHCVWDGATCSDVVCADRNRKQCTEAKTNGACAWSPEEVSRPGGDNKWEAANWACRAATYEPTCNGGRRTVDVTLGEDLTVEPCTDLRFPFTADSEALWQFNSSGCYAKCSFRPKHEELADGTGTEYLFEVRLSSHGETLMFADEEGCDDGLKSKVKVMKVKFAKN